MRSIGIGLALVAVLLFLGARLTGCSCDTCRPKFCGRGPQPKLDFIVIPLPGGGRFIHFPDKIPKDQQVGCDVCPFWCTQFDLTPAAMDELIPYYVHLAKLHLDEDNRLENDDQLERLGCMAARSEPAERARFLELLHHQDPRVRYVAAVHALGLGMAVQEPLDTLRALAAHPGELGKRAAYAVDDHAFGEKVEL